MIYDIYAAVAVVVFKKSIRNDCCQTRSGGALA